MVATMHSLERAKDRIGMNQKTAEHFMRNALARGKDKTMYTSERRRWLTAKEDACGCKALVYNDMCLSPCIKCRTGLGMPFDIKGRIEFATRQSSSGTTGVLQRPYKASGENRRSETAAASGGCRCFDV